MADFHASLSMGFAIGPEKLASRRSQHYVGATLAGVAHPMGSDPPPAAFCRTASFYIPGRPVLAVPLGECGWRKKN
jgi:hypothetical protein